MMRPGHRWYLGDGGRSCRTQRPIRRRHEERQVSVPRVCQWLLSGNEVVSLVTQISLALASTFCGTFRSLQCLLWQLLEALACRYPLYWKRPNACLSSPVEGDVSLPLGLQCPVWQHQYFFLPLSKWSFLFSPFLMWALDPYVPGTEQVGGIEREIQNHLWGGSSWSHESWWEVMENVSLGEELEWNVLVGVLSIPLILGTLSQRIAACVPSLLQRLKSAPHFWCVRTSVINGNANWQMLVGENQMHQFDLIPIIRVISCFPYWWQICARNEKPACLPKTWLRVFWWGHDLCRLSIISLRSEMSLGRFLIFFMEVWFQRLFKSP